MTPWLPWRVPSSSNSWPGVSPLFTPYVRVGLRWERAEEHRLRRLLRAVRAGGGSAGAGDFRLLTVLRTPVADIYENNWSLTGRKVPDRTVYAAGSRALSVKDRA